jgi:hypothetical protein
MCHSYDVRSPSSVYHLPPFLYPTSLTRHPFLLHLYLSRFISSLHPHVLLSVPSLSISSVMYFDSVTSDGISGCLLKVEALQGMDRFEEAVSECEIHLTFIKGKGSWIHLYCVILTVTVTLTHTVHIHVDVNRQWRICNCILVPPH